MVKKMMKTKSGENFRNGILLVLGIVALSVAAFMTEDMGITGQVAGSYAGQADINSNLKEISSLKSLNEMAPGNYFISSEGIVYWMDDPSNPPVARIVSLNEFEKGRMVFIDRDGNIGFLFSESPSYAP